MSSLGMGFSVGAPLDEAARWPDLSAPNLDPRHGAPVASPALGPKPPHSAANARPDFRRMALQEMETPARHVVYDVGDCGDSLYKVLRGWVVICKPLRDGRRSILDVVEAGEFFGFCAHDRHDCMAVTTASTVLQIYRTDDLLAHPAYSRRVFDSAIRQFERLQDLTSLRARRAIERVAAFLAGLARNEDDLEPTIELPLSRGEIGEHLELTVETVSRCVSAMKRAAVIRPVGQRRIEVLDLARLKAVAEGALALEEAASEPCHGPLARSAA